MKNYKKSGMIIFLMMSFFARTYAQDTISGSTVTETAALDQKGMSDMNAVSMRFCNSGITETGIQANLYATTRPGKTQRICAMFFNNMETGTNFHVQFSEAIKNEYNNRLCDQDGKDNDFARLVREDFAEMKISVKPHTQSYRTFNLAIPEDTTGDILGCLGYYLDGSLTQKTGSVFGILLRKTAPIRIHVTGKVYKYGRRDDIKSVYQKHQSSILKVIAAILVILIFANIFGSKKKENKPHHKK